MRSFLRRRCSHLFFVCLISIFGIDTAAFVPAGAVVISEFRTHGTNSFDEFIELYNTTTAAIDITDCKVEVEGGTTINITSGSIPARGHYLLANSPGYSLSSYANADLQYLMNQPANAGLRLIDGAGTVIDAVGFEASSTGFKEGTGLAPVSESISNQQYSFVRSQAITGLPQDTGNNSMDFLLVATEPPVTGSNIGSPGPQNTTSHKQYSPATEMVSRLIDQSVSASTSPNRTRDTNSYRDDLTPSSPSGLFTVFPGVSVPATSYAFGTLSVQRRIANNTVQTVTKLRFRIIDITTGPTPASTSPVADLRVLTSNGVLRAPPVPPGVLLRGSKIDRLPTQHFGGGYNNTLTVDLTATPSGKLLPGQWVDVQFLLGVVKGGSFRFFWTIEAVLE